MTTTYDTDPNTQTIAAAWASSLLGQAKPEVGDGFATAGPDAAVTYRDEPPTAKRVMVAAGLACGIAAGALTGVMLFYTTDSAQPTVAVPGPNPQHAVIIGPSTAAPTPKPVVVEHDTAPNTATPAPRSAPRTAAVTTPPAPSQGNTTVVIDVPIPTYPPLPEKPGQQDPEPPKPEDPDPEPPVLDDPNFKQPEPPKPPDLHPGKFQAPQLPDPQSPKPEPPSFVPDLPLTPKPPVVIDPLFGP
jgi:hypothetical protein